MPIVHATLRGLAGAAPLCTSGTYPVDATVRPTLRICGGQPCTLIDQHVSLPIIADGRDLDGDAPSALGTLGLVYDSVELLAFRLLDPMGSPIAASDVNQVRNLACGSASLRRRSAAPARATTPHAVADPDACPTSTHIRMHAPIHFGAPQYVVPPILTSAPDQFIKSPSRR